MMDRAQAPAALTFIGRGVYDDGIEVRTTGTLAEVQATLAGCPFTIISPQFIVTLDMLSDMLSSDKAIRMSERMVVAERAKWGKGSDG